MPLEMNDDDNLLIRYLLGEGGEDERGQLEDRLFADDELFERLVAAEAELTDAYASGDLSPEVRAALERGPLATPGGRDRLAFARALGARAAASRDVAPRSSAPVPWWASFVEWISARPLVAGVAAGAVVVLAFVIWSAVTPPSASQRAGVEPPAPVVTPEVEPSTPPPDVRPDANANVGPGTVTPHPAPTQPAPPKPKVAPSTASLLAFAFAPPTTRGVEELRVLRVPPSTATVRLELGLPEDAGRTLDASLDTADGRNVLRRSRVRANAGRLTLDVDAKMLAAEEYVVTLTSSSDHRVVADYLFRVARD